MLLQSFSLYKFSFPLVLQIQRSLAAPAQSKTENDVQPKAVQPAPALSRALARVLSATESKENDAETEHPNMEEFKEDNRPAGETQIFVAKITMTGQLLKHIHMCQNVLLW